MGTVAIAFAIMLAAAACGGSSSGDRVAECQKQSLKSFVQSSDQISGELAQRIATDPKVTAATTAICKEAEKEGMLEDGATSEDSAKLMRTHPELITPICQVAYREGLGAGVTPDVAARLPGGLDGLAADFCRDLGPYVQGTAINWPQLYQDRGRKTFVAICSVAAVDSAEQDPRNPFSAADTMKLFTTVCGQAWDGGYVSQDGTVDDAAVRLITRRTVREMIRSGKIHVRQS